MGIPNHNLQIETREIETNRRENDPKYQRDILLTQETSAVTEKSMELLETLLSKREGRLGICGGDGGRCLEGLVRKRLKVSTATVHAVTSGVCAMSSGKIRRRSRQWRRYCVKRHQNIVNSGLRILAPTLYIFIASGLPVIAFGEQLSRETGERYHKVYQIYYICYFPRHNASEAEMKEAARIANAHHFISSLAHGYDTQIVMRGAELTQGQEQRIAIARVVLKNAPLLLIDEASSSIESESSRVVQEALDTLIMGNKTTILIAQSGDDES